VRRLRKRGREDEDGTLDMLADAATAATTCSHAVQMLTPAISCILFTGAELLACDLAVYVRKQFSKEKTAQHNFLVEKCPQSFPAELKCRLSSLIMSMMPALNQHAEDPHIEQFEMGFCSNGCNTLKQRYILWCCMYCLCGGGVWMHMVVYGCMWWCMYVSCGGGGVRMHTVVYGFDRAHRPHKDTPPGYLQFAFACTDMMSAHVSTEDDLITDEEAFKNLSAYGLVLNQSERNLIRGLDVFRDNKVLTCSVAALQQKTGPETSAFVKRGSLLSWQGGRLHSAPACTEERIVIFAEIRLKSHVSGLVYDNFAAVDEVALLAYLFFEVASHSLKNKLLRCCVVRYLSLKNSGLINNDFINLFQLQDFKHFFIQVQQTELEIQRLIDAYVHSHSK
jgi:hypothetical protein